MIEFTIPGAPVPKERPRVGRGGHVYTPQRTREYERAVAVLAHAHGARPVTGPIRVEIAVFFADSRRRDLDNAIKAIWDGLNGIAFADDSQVVELVATKGIDRMHPRAVVRVEAAACPQDTRKSEQATSGRTAQEIAPAARTGALVGR
jgi:crossover junction endodeoxyribonuclease RusA